MAATVTITRQLKNDIFLVVFGTIALTGSYSVNGETIAIAGLKTGKTTPLSFQVTGKLGYTYLYDYQNAKLKVFVNTAGGANTALGEATAAAYSGFTPDATTDVITFEAQYLTP